MCVCVMYVVLLIYSKFAKFFPGVPQTVLFYARATCLAIKLWVVSNLPQAQGLCSLAGFLHYMFLMVCNCVGIRWRVWRSCLRAYFLWHEKVVENYILFKVFPEWKFSQMNITEGTKTISSRSWKSKQRKNQYENSQRGKMIIH